MGRRARILLVEDDEVGGTLLVELLGSLGEVRWTTSAEEAFETISGRDWDLIVSDIDLPGIDGIELVHHVKRERPKLATLILSSHSSFDHAVAAMRAGADDYMTKPFDPVGLVEKARTLVAVTRERRAAGQDVVLAVGAHPDDVEIGIGGILLRHAAEGHEVTVLTLTGGEAGGVASDRAAESQRAAELMSARLIHASLTDTSVSEGGSTIGTIVEVIDEIKPDDGLHAHQPRRPPGPPQRAQRDAGRRPRHLARLLLPGAVHQRRVQADALRGDRRVPRAQDRGHPGLLVAGQAARATSTRSCCAPPPATGRASARRATSSRSRWCATATRRRSRPPPRCRGATMAESPRVLVTGVGGPSGISILRAMDGYGPLLCAITAAALRRRAAARGDGVGEDGKTGTVGDLA